MTVYKHQYYIFFCQISTKQIIINLDLLVKPTKFLQLHAASWITTKYRPWHDRTFLLKMKRDTWKCILQASNQIRLGFCVLYIITILTLDTDQHACHFIIATM